MGWLCTRCNTENSFDDNRCRACHSVMSGGYLIREKARARSELHLYRKAVRKSAQPNPSVWEKIALKRPAGIIRRANAAAMALLITATLGYSLTGPVLTAAEQLDPGAPLSSDALVHAMQNVYEVGLLTADTRLTEAGYACEQLVLQSRERILSLGDTASACASSADANLYEATVQTELKKAQADARLLSLRHRAYEAPGLRILDKRILPQISLTAPDRSNTILNRVRQFSLDEWLEQIRTFFTAPFDKS